MTGGGLRLALRAFGCAVKGACGVLAVATLAGCAGGGAGGDGAGLVTSALPEGKGRIVLERTNETLHATAPATAKLNGATVASVDVGDTVIVDVPAGVGKLSVETWSYPGTFTIPVDVKPGETIKVEIAPRPGTGASAILGPIGAMVDKDEQGNGGAFTVRQLAYIDPRVDAVTRN